MYIFTPPNLKKPATTPVIRERYRMNVFARHDFNSLANKLQLIEGRFILSINDVPQIRKIFRRANVDAVETTYSVGKNEGLRVSELIISNLPTKG